MWHILYTAQGRAMHGEQVASNTADIQPDNDTAIRTLPSEPVGSPICIRTHNRAKIRYSRRKVTRADRAGAGAVRCWLTETGRGAEIPAQVRMARFPAPTGPGLCGHLPLSGHSRGSYKVVGLSGSTFGG